MVWHMIAKSRPTNLCFWMLLTKHFRSFPQMIHQVAPLQFHFISIFISNLVSTFFTYNVFVLHTWNYDWNNIRAVEVHYVCFHSICHTEGFFCTFFLNMVSSGNNFTARFLNTTFFFLALFGKLLLTFLVWFASVLLDLYDRLPVAWGGEISSCHLFCLCFRSSIFLFSWCCAFSSLLIHN